MICEEINADIPIMDIFSDLYEFSQLLLEIGNDDAFAGNGNFRAIDMAVKDRQSSEGRLFP